MTLLVLGLALKVITYPHRTSIFILRQRFNILWELRRHMGTINLLKRRRCHNISFLFAPLPCILFFKKEKKSPWLERFASAAVGWRAISQIVCSWSQQLDAHPWCALESTEVNGKSVGTGLLYCDLSEGLCVERDRPWIPWRNPVSDTQWIFKNNRIRMI